MNNEKFTTWLEHYQKAWENRNPGAAVQLFTPDATYQETPFDIPMRGTEEILEYWQEVPRSQKDIHFDWQILFCDHHLGVAHWRAEFIRISSETKILLDGILTAEFSDEDLCCNFREWWHRQENNNILEL